MVSIAENPVPKETDPSERNFMRLLKERWTSANTLLMVGLDSEYEKLPAHLRETLGSDKGAAILAFNKGIINATCDLVCGYKPNLAFYRSMGSQGGEALVKTVEYIHEVDPRIPVVLDAKYGDIDNTAQQYAKEAFDLVGADAVTISGYMGLDAAEPFLSREGKGVILLCRTSNKNARDFQDMIVKHEILGEVPLYKAVAYKAKEWNDKHGNISLVMGVTYPQEMKAVREMVGDMPFLVPGLGKGQGGRPEDVPNGFDSNKQGVMANVSRGILFASSGLDFAQAARAEAIRLRDAINVYR